MEGKPYQAEADPSSETRTTSLQHPAKVGGLESPGGTPSGLRPASAPAPCLASPTSPTSIRWYECKKADSRSGFFHFSYFPYLFRKLYTREDT